MILSERINEIWQQLHSIPEPAFCEFKTAAFAANILRQAGYEVCEEVGGTGVVGLLDSKKDGPVVGLRSDMDCLLFTEGDKKIGIHACGHDAHMAIVLTVAELIAKKGITCGKVKIIMQPAEEIGCGAKALLATGIIDDIDCLFGLHLMPEDLASSGQIVAQVHWTAATLLEAKITGRTAHGSMPHLGINAIDVGCSIVNSINALHMNPLEGWSLKTTRFRTGEGALNAICDFAELGFDLRTTKNSEMELLKKKVIHIIKNTAELYGAKAEVEQIGDCPGSEDDPELLELIKKSITNEVGSTGLILERTTTVGEDFNFYKQLRPELKTGFIGLGCALTPGLHDRNMHFNHADLIHGVNVLYNLVLSSLNCKNFKK
ncbi:MAG: amidohydrolase [Acidaminococcaceae bacterium]